VVEHTTTQTTTSTRPDLNPQTVGALYTAGMSVNDIAVLYNEPYSRIRRLLRESGTPVRDASARLKGRTRRSTKSAGDTSSES
jgi:hypothetical protein